MVGGKERIETGSDGASGWNILSQMPDMTANNVDNNQDIGVQRSSFRHKPHTDTKRLEKQLKDQTPFEQFKYLDSLLNSSIFALDAGWFRELPVEELELIQNSESSTPLIKLLAKTMEDDFIAIISDRNEVDDYWDGDNEVDGGSSNVCEEELTDDEGYEMARKVLVDKKNGIDNYDVDCFAVYRIAPGTIAVLESVEEGWLGVSLSGNEFALIADEKGVVYSEFPSHKGVEPRIDEQTKSLLSLAHNPIFRPAIEERLDVKLADVSLGAQIQLLKFVTEADDGRFDKLCQTMHEVDENLRLKLIENFLAADFGKDFGDSLLTIAGSECLDNDEKEKIFDMMSSCRESISKITGLYDEFDNGQFAKEFTRASNERLTDIIKALDRIAKRSVAEADLDWAGRSRFDYESAMEALEYEAKSLEIISGTLSDVSSGAEGAFAETVMHPDPSSQRLMRTWYNFYSPSYGYVLLYTRPEGSHSFDPMTEHGKTRSKYDEGSINAGIEASISLITNPVDPFSLPNIYIPDSKAICNPNYYDPSMMDNVSAIRLDREGRAPGMAANDPRRDPVNPVGMVSVDLAAIGDRADTPSGKIARLISVGGKLREEAGDVDDFSLNHNTKWFNQEKYGTEKGFRKLVRYVDKMATEWCTKHGPTDDKESFRKKMRQASKSRGRKARRAA